jgi:hypothetical protein
MPESAVFATLSEAKDAHRSGQIRKNPGSFFTHLIKLRAAGLGIDLSTSRRPRPEIDGPMTAQSPETPRGETESGSGSPDTERGGSPLQSVA